MLRIVLAALVLAGLQSSAAIVAVAPNPVTPGDSGEYLVLTFPTETDLGNWSVSDGETTVRFPNATVQGRVVATTDPGAVRNVTNLPIVELRGHLALANGGEEIRLRRGNETVDVVSYDRAPEGERYVRTADGWEWQHPAGTDRPPTSARDVRARFFVFPDAPSEAVAPFEDAADRILLAGYTFASRRVTSALCDARKRGVAVRVLVDREPVGGITRRSARTLDDLVDCDVDVDVIGGEHSRYAFHHPKYAIVDDHALVLTENWKPAGTGGHSSRGWGVLVDGDAVTRALVETYETDAGWRDVEGWGTARDELQLAESDPPPSERYPARFEPSESRLDRVEVLLAPDNAEGRIVEALDRAEERVFVQQVSIDSRGQPFVRALVRAAERGVRVRVLLSSAWYVREENDAMATWLNEHDDLPIEARLAEPRSRFGKIHAKGAVVDDEIAILGSVNWNNASVRENREVTVILHGEAAAGYYGRVVRADWRGGTWRLPLGFPAAAVLVAVGCAAFGRRIEFEDQ